MDTILPIVFSVVLVIITIILSIVGVQMVMILSELRNTLKKVNATLDMAESKFNALVSPLQNLGGMAAGLQTGFKVFESFANWLNRKKNDGE